MKRIAAVSMPLMLLSCAERAIDVSELVESQQIPVGVLTSVLAPLVDSVDDLAAYHMGEGNDVHIFLPDIHVSGYQAGLRKRLKEIYSGLTEAGIDIDCLYLEGFHKDASMESIRELMSLQEETFKRITGDALRMIEDIRGLQQLLGDDAANGLITSLADAVVLQSDIILLCYDVELSHEAGSINAPGSAYLDVIDVPISGIESRAELYLARCVALHQMLSNYVPKVQEVMEDLKDVEFSEDVKVSGELVLSSIVTDFKNNLAMYEASFEYCEDFIPQDVMLNLPELCFHYLCIPRTERWVDNVGEGVSLIIGGAAHAQPYYELLVERDINAAVFQRLPGIYLSHDTWTAPR